MNPPILVPRDIPPKSYPAGSTIFSEGDTGTSMYIVSEGEVEIWIHGKVVETVTADHFFGEMALLDDPHRTARAVAKTDCKLVPISRERFLFMVQETPYFALRVMKALSTRLRSVDARL